MKAVCQRCGERESSWTITQAEFHVGELAHWKVQMCERCTATVQEVLKTSLTPFRPSPEEPAQK